MDILKGYVEAFNRDDEETCRNLIDNEAALGWLREEIPLLECPDKDIERTYYFRFWTYRKHLKHTEDGYVITEFLPNVPWSGKHNTINAAVGHHLCEGRWLKNASLYLNDYVEFFLSVSEKSHMYSTWLIDAVYKLFSVTGAKELDKGLINKLVKYYEKWEELHGLDNGMFWSIDNYDAMEYSISGTSEEWPQKRGIRPTLNSYMCADALALSRLAAAVGENEISARFMHKHLRLKEQINGLLWKDGFYRAFHYKDGESIEDTLKSAVSSEVREEIGYIPWMFNIPEGGKEAAFDLLTDESAFFSEQGITTAERSHRRFLYKADHECLWNGYVWPFATSQTLTALINLIDNYEGTERFKEVFIKLLTQYAVSHHRVREDGKTVCWIDEVRHPLYDDWSSRTILRDWGWQRQGKGGYERGKDYNHSTFCDLVISGLIGIKTDSGELRVNPSIPDDWDYFRLSNLHFRGKCYTVTYDKHGTKYGSGKGLTVTEE